MTRSKTVAALALATALGACVPSQYGGGYYDSPSYYGSGYGRSYYPATYYTPPAPRYRPRHDHDRSRHWGGRRGCRDGSWCDRDDNPPGPAGGPGTNWENPPGPRGGPGASPDRRRWSRRD